MMSNLIKTWREAWSATPGTTPPDFPFGLVSLAGGTSEGHGANMGAFRYAQTMNTGFGDVDKKIFVAQAFDAAGDPYALCRRKFRPPYTVSATQICPPHAGFRRW